MYEKSHGPVYKNNGYEFVSVINKKNKTQLILLIVDILFKWIMELRLHDPVGMLLIVK